MLGLLVDFTVTTTSPTLLRRLHVLVTVTVVLVHALQVQASPYAEFPADGGNVSPKGLLRTAVDAYCASSDPSAFTFSVGDDDYGPIEDWRTGLVTNMANLFYGKAMCNPDIGGWDTSSVTDMSDMFPFATSFNGDLSGWDTAKVTNMRSMFFHASSFNGNVSTWDTAKVTTMSLMFEGANSFSGDLSNWDVSSVTNMRSMFFAAYSFNSDLSKWNIAKVTNMDQMFTASSFNQNLCSWKSNFPYHNSNDIFLKSACTFRSDPVEAALGPFCGNDCKPSSQPSFVPSLSRQPSSLPSLTPSKSAVPPSSHPLFLTPSLIQDMSSEASKSKASKATKASKAAPYRRRRKRLRIRST